METSLGFLFSSLITRIQMPAHETDKLGTIFCKYYENSEWCPLLSSHFFLYSHMHAFNNDANLLHIYFGPRSVLRTCDHGGHT